MYKILANAKLTFSVIFKFSNLLHCQIYCKQWALPRRHRITFFSILKQLSIDSVRLELIKVLQKLFGKNWSVLDNFFLLGLSNNALTKTIGQNLPYQPYFILKKKTLFLNNLYFENYSSKDIGLKTFSIHLCISYMLYK